VDGRKLADLATMPSVGANAGTPDRISTSRAGLSGEKSAERTLF
jgi:hypothetical protein